MQEFSIINIIKAALCLDKKTKSKCLSEIEIKVGTNYLIQDYYLNCFQYIHQNPVVAKMVEQSDDWEFSSFKDYAGLRNGTLCHKELATLHCNYNPHNFIQNSQELADKKLIPLFT